jgi:uncharacterized protein
MINVTFKFQGNLKDHLPLTKRVGSYSTVVTPRSSVKDAIQSQHVPRVEIDYLKVNGKVAPFTILLHENDEIEVWPKNNFENGDRLIPPYSNPISFLLDVHLGRLAGYMRLCGFDTAYFNIDISDTELVKQATLENRILLSCDRFLMMRNNLKWGYVVRSRDPKKQLIEVLKYFDLKDKSEPFIRCMSCNGELIKAKIGTIENKAPPRVLKRFEDHAHLYTECDSCGKLFWPGDHYTKMVVLLEEWGIKYDKIRDIPS